MQMTEAQAQASAPIAAFQRPVQRETDAQSDAVRLLDQVIPLKDGSHADVVRYVVEIPMRYAECFAMLKSGRKVAFRDRRRFIGWTRDEQQPSYLFRKNLLTIEVRTSDTGEHAVADVVLESAVRSVQRAEDSSADQERRFIGTDGSLVTLPGRRLMSVC